MTTLTLQLPESLTQALYQHRVSQEQLHAVVINAIEDWLRQFQSSVLPKETPPASLFADSAIPFVEQLLDNNQSLFERLAKL
jgi:hypothetical protein